MSTGRADVLFHVQHLLGIGHLRRAARVARALGDAGLEVVLASGGTPEQGLGLGRARLVQLPPIRARDSLFSGLVDATTGAPLDEHAKARRRDALLALLRETAPRIVLLEMYPFGRRQMRFELEPLVAAARAMTPRPWIVTSLRDILVSSKAEKWDWMVTTARRDIDLVLVHGDPAFVSLERSFPPAAALADKLRYTGYVVEPPPAAVPNGEVLVSTGGGAVAAPLIRAALEARPLTAFADAPWRVLIGQAMPPEAFEEIRRGAPGGVVVERARPDFTSLLAGARLSISQAGYNTMLEVLAAGIPAVVVPFDTTEETEQGLRARLFAERGALAVVEDAAPTGRSLAAAIARITEPGARADAPLSDLDTGGAAHSAELLRALLAMAPP